jgi:AraC family transcriptional regulator
MDKIKQDYIYRINNVINYIKINSDSNFKLDELAEVANFSKFHFSRIFFALVGETPLKFILRVKIEKAASMLIHSMHLSITSIAYELGFSDIAIFSRNFKKYYGVSPKQYRTDQTQNRKNSQKESNSSKYNVNSPSYFCKINKHIKIMNNLEINKSIEVKTIKAKNLAYVRSIGAYDGDQSKFKINRDKILNFAHVNNLMQRENFQFLVVYHDNPNISLSENLIMDLCVTSDPDIEVDGEIGKMKFEEAKYIVAKFELRGDQFQQAWNWLYSEWIPESGLKLADKPSYEVYLTPPVHGNYQIEICIPVD